MLPAYSYSLLQDFFYLHPLSKMRETVYLHRLNVNLSYLTGVTMHS